MPKAFSADEKTEIQRRLLTQGYRLFAAHGLRKVTVEELAAAAGVSKGAFYLFYPSKEALFLAVAEETEMRFRRQVLATVDQPGPTPRARLFAVLQHAFTLWRTLPILQAFAQGDYEAVARRVPAEQLQTHLQSDETFVIELLARCKAAGIPIQANAQEMNAVLHALFFTSMHANDLGPNRLEGALNLLLELVAAYYLGEVDIQHATLTTLLQQQADADHVG